VRIFTAHTRADSPPVLVREGFSWGAFIFGPFWLLARRAWIAGVLALCASVAIAALAAEPVRSLLSLTLAWVLGLTGQDLRRAALQRRGYLLAHVVAAADGDAALARLLARRPDLIKSALR
jgi:predicted outer membrane lipoprotein